MIGGVELKAGSDRFLRMLPCIYPVAKLLWHCSKEKTLMLMPIATYPFFARADQTAVHVCGLDAVTPSKNVTLAERLAR
jgi:hypothetical protein